MELYIIKVKEGENVFEYENGNMEHVKEHLKMETGSWTVYKYENGIETEIKIEEEE